MWKLVMRVPIPHWFFIIGLSIINPHPLTHQHFLISYQGYVKKLIQLFVEFESTKCWFSYYNGLCLAYKKLRFTIWHKSWPIWYFYWIVVRYNEAQNSKWFWLTLHHLSFCVRWVRCDTNHKRIVVGFYNIIFKWQLKHIIKI